MNSLHKFILKTLFSSAWAMAKAAAKKHGGYAGEFFAESLRIKWAVIHIKKSEQPQKQSDSFQLPTAYSGYKGQNVTGGGWLASEKYNGIFARFDGKNLLSKTGKVFHCPNWFIAGLPAGVEGELFIKNGALGQMAGIARAKNADWSSVKFMIFNRISAGGYAERMAVLKNTVLPAHVHIVKQTAITSHDQLKTLLDSIMSTGGEGVVIRHSADNYQHGLSNRIFKLKPRQDTEGLIIGTVEGKGKMRGLVACAMVLYNGIHFKLPVFNRVCFADMGKKITFSYQELSAHGTPLQAQFIEIRDYE